MKGNPVCFYVADVVRCCFGEIFKALCRDEADTSGEMRGHVKSDRFNERLKM